MFQHIEVAEPIEKIADDWDYLQDRVLSRFAGFRPAGQNIFGIRRRLITPEGVTDPRKGNTGQFIELGPQGLTEGISAALKLRLTAAGVPHRVRHNFGYWHINDKDELYVPIPAEVTGELGHYIVVMGAPSGKESESFAWFCEKCHTILYDHVVDTGKYGLAVFWKGEREAVDIYNADVNLRTCPECGHVNPHGYCWNSAKDSAEEAAARRAW
ncbi:MAG: hypothetical protein QM696_04485 [Steroidobacteraceae bacterium]